MAKNEQTNHINREISWLAFNERVLQEAADENCPLIERMRFLGIYSNNLDEFFRVRVAALRRMVRLAKKDISELEDDPAVVLKQVLKVVKKQQKRYEDLFKSLKADLKNAGIHLLETTELSTEQLAFITKYFNNHVRHLLHPILLDSRSNPLSLADHAIYQLVCITYANSKQSTPHAVIQLPSHLSRFVVLPKVDDQNYLMFIDDVIRLKLDQVFWLQEGDEIAAYAMKITRDAELDLDQDISKSLLKKLTKSLAKRQSGEYVRFVYDREMPLHAVRFIANKLKLSGRDEQIAGGRYHNKKDFMDFPVMGRTDLCFEPRESLQHPHLMRYNRLFEALSGKDVLLHYPYQSFSHVVQLLREAAIDPSVRSIKINLYRIAANSHVANALLNAAKNGIEVTVLIELQARFDESNNIKWSKKLQRAGAKVINGVTGLKVHSKLLLIRRVEKNKSVLYGHIGTGNFHEKTANVYSDLTLLTTRKSLCTEIRRLFSYFEDPTQPVQFRHLMVSPFNTRQRLTRLVKNEIRHAKSGQPAEIVLKLNNLVDPQMIKLLYSASIAGVRIKLLIRGICSLVPGIKGQSENISVISIVGRYLEHARVYKFLNAGSPLYFISSADWMARNLDYRIEVAAPILDVTLQHEIDEILRIQLSGNVKARKLGKHQKNKPVKREKDEPAFHAQDELYRYYQAQLE